MQKGGMQSQTKTSSARAATDPVKVFAKWKRSESVTSESYAESKTMFGECKYLFESQQCAN